MSTAAACGYLSLLACQTGNMMQYRHRRSEVWLNRSVSGELFPSFSLMNAARVFSQSHCL